MARIPRSFIDNKPAPPVGADPLLSPERYRVHPVGNPWWGDFSPAPRVTVSVGDGRAVLRLTDASAAEPLTPDQWSRAQAVAERVAVPIGDGDDRPLVFVHRTLVVEVPSLAKAERLAHFLLTLALPTGSLP
jgi:hypothetical protein